MTDEAKALVERVAMLPDGNAWPSTVELLCDLRDCIETQAREIERLREALSHAQGRFLNINIALSSGGTKREAIRIADVGEDCAKNALARAALGDSHDQ